MATIIESFAGDYLLNKLVTFAEEKVVMILGAKDELKRLEKRLRWVGAYLKDAEKRRISEDTIKNWLNELKDLVYDADDMIDLWRYKNQQLPIEEPSSSSSLPTCCYVSPFSCFRTIAVRHELAEQVQTLNSRLDDILKDMSSLNLQHIQSNIQEVRRINAPATSPVIGVDVVGKEIEEAAKKLIKVATLDGNKRINIAAITGMGGIGKTTLAKKIYNNQTIQKKYVIQIWLSITQDYSFNQLIKEAIRFAGGDPGQAEREPELLPILARAISEKSLFLVLDDVWCPDVWLELLQDTVRTNATQAFILVTTRDQTVAMQMGAKHIHQATILSAKSGWELLCRRAYLSDIQDIKNLEEIGTKIVEKCGGLPIAIKAIGCMLAKKDKNKNEWQNVLASSVWSTKGLPKDIDQALYLSYEDLSPELRQCFLYCSLFPPNRNINRRVLVRLWIAEGFVEERSEITAEEYYQELIARHLLEPNLEISVDYGVCKMHDLLRSLALYLSREETATGNELLMDPHVTSKLRRLSIERTNENALILGPATKQLRLRTFIIFDCQDQMENKIFVMLKYLRVLYINEKGLNCIPESIGDLIHLRMLDLNSTSISTLPESIGSLTNLLILSLEDCELLHTLPRGITRLYNLRHLNLLKTPLNSVPKGLGRLQKLTEIMGFIVGDGNHDDGNHNGWDLQELEGLSQLRNMTIHKLKRARNVSVILANKTHLKKLILDFSVLNESNGHVEQFENENGREIIEKLCPPPSIEEFRIFYYRGKMLPRWMSSSLEDLLPNLQYLLLFGWSCCPVIPPLGSLPNLKFLRVQDASAIVRIDSEFLGIREWKGPKLPTAFPKLEYIRFENIPNWEKWVLYDFEGEKSESWKLMPRIKDFRIKNCPKLSALPEDLQRLVAIEKIIVDGVDSVHSIQDFLFECVRLEVINNWCLESMSNLSGVKKIVIAANPNLRRVSKLDSLEHLELRDYEMQQLPEWLIELMEERKGQNKDELHLDVLCNTTLLERCLKDGPDWPIIKCFSSVTIHNRERTAYMEYTREPESYMASL